MAFTRPPRKAVIPPTPRAVARGQGSVDARGDRPRSRRPEASVKPPKTEARVGTDPTRRPASAQLVADVRSGQGVNRALFARLTGLPVRAISGWEAGRPISEAGLRRVEEMERRRAALADGMREEFIPGDRLEDAVRRARGAREAGRGAGSRGEADRPWRAVLMIGSGMAT